MKALLFVLALTATAHAYPQFQLSLDQTCAGCHVSPSGGGLLAENGLNTIESLSRFGGTPGFLHDKVSLPSWLALGGDIRAAGGVVKPSADYESAAFPMQAELYARATFGAISLHVTAGAQDPQHDSMIASDFDGATLFGSREHYVTYNDDELYIRAGLFLPVFGLRLAEHQSYVRRYGPVPLDAEAYGVAVDYVDARAELHVTAFTHDRITDPVQHGDGAALYAEARLTDKAQVGVEGMVVAGPDDQQYWTGVTGKLLATDSLLLLGEVQYALDYIDQSAYTARLNAYAMASYMRSSFMIDLGAGYSTLDARVSGLDRDGVDLNVHWFGTSHGEVVLANHVQALDFGAGGRPSGYSLLMLHYRL